MKKVLCGNEMDRMPDWAFRIMAFMFNVTDAVKSPGRRLDAFDIKKGQTVVDWGCGTGRYLRQACELTGDSGVVYAVDIHPLAVESAAAVANKYKLKTIHPVLTDGKSAEIPSRSADVIYALDMFHMVSDPNGFLEELYRIAKPGGLLYLEDGHQQRELARQKVNNSGRWEIVSETRGYLECKPR